MIVPAEPRELFEEFLPRQAASLGLQLPELPASLCVHVLGAGSWTLSLAHGGLQVDAGMQPDTLLQLSLELRDFPLFVVAPLERAVAALDAGPVAPAASSIIQRVSRWDEETLGLLRSQRGSIVTTLSDAEQQHHVALTLGGDAPTFDEPRCRLTCELEDVVAVQEGRSSATDLLYGGRLRMEGDAQIALALAGLFL